MYQPVGAGRGSPNENPYLPYPPGRLDYFSLLNPFNLIYEFFGLTVSFYYYLIYKNLTKSRLLKNMLYLSLQGLCICCCIICICIVALLGTLLSGLMSVIAAVKMIQEDAEKQQEAAEEFKKHPPWENISKPFSN